MDSGQNVWYNTREPARIGLPAPIKTLLESSVELRTHVRFERAHS